MEEINESVQEQEKSPVATVSVCDIQFRSGSKIYYFDPAEFTLKAGDHVMIETSRGPEFGYCTAGRHTVTMREIVLPLRKVLRLATPADEKQNDENKEKEKHAFEVCLKKIEELGLEMQLVSAEYAFDGSKILFFFTADGRVDFRELVKALAAVFRTRIELRQIGMRDKAKMVGGFGICGRPFCCGQFLDDFQPVSIKMAKTQNLSLNPAKISGTCGRLMCCLKYEQEAYEDLIKTSPKPESFVDTVEGRGTVTDVNLMAQTVKVRMEKDPEEIKCFKNCDICVLRNGKSKKTDPPIPEDFAPLSGSRAAQAPEQYPRFERRRTVEALVEEQKDEVSAVAEAAAEEAVEKAGDGARKSRNNRRHRQKNRPAAAKPESAEPVKAPEKKQRNGGKKPQKQPEKQIKLTEKTVRLPDKQAMQAEKSPKAQQQTAQQTDGKKSSRRNNFYRHRRHGSKPSGGTQE